MWRFDLVEAPAPGTVRRGHVAWGDAGLAGWDWPYVAVNGARPGPAVVVTAGYHGSEYPSIDAVVRLGATLDPATVSGQILCLPLMNPQGFWERTAYVVAGRRAQPQPRLPGEAEWAGERAARLSPLREGDPQGRRLYRPAWRRSAGKPAAVQHLVRDRQPGNRRAEPGDGRGVRLAEPRGTARRRDAGGRPSLYRGLEARHPLDHRRGRRGRAASGGRPATACCRGCRMSCAASPSCRARHGR